MKTYEDAIKTFDEFRQEFMDALPGFDDPHCCKMIAVDMLDCLDTVLRAGMEEGK